MKASSTKGMSRCRSKGITPLRMSSGESAGRQFRDALQSWQDHLHIFKCSFHRIYREFHWILWHFIRNFIGLTWNSMSS